MNANKKSRLRAMARSYIGSMRLNQLLGEHRDYSGIGYYLTHRHLQEFLEEDLSDEDAEHFYE